MQSRYMHTQVGHIIQLYSSKRSQHIDYYQMEGKPRGTAVATLVLCLALRLSMDGLPSR